MDANWSGKLSCVTGVACGTSLWFVTLSYAVSRGYKKFTEKTLLRMEHISGLSLIILAVAHAVYVVLQVHHH